MYFRLNKNLKLKKMNKLVINKLGQDLPFICQIGFNLNYLITSKGGLEQNLKLIFWIRIR